MIHIKDRKARLQRKCSHIAIACLFIAIAAPPIIVCDWLFSGSSVVFQRNTGITLSHPPSTAGSAIGLVLTAVPAILLSLSVFQARLSFLAFGSGDWFSEIPPKALAACGRWAFIASLFSLILPSLLALALTMEAPAGERFITISISSGPVLGILFGAILWSLGVIWANARNLSLENEQFV